MKNSIYKLALIIVFVGFFNSPLEAKKKKIPNAFEVQGPRIFSIQDRPRRLGHEFEIGLGILAGGTFPVSATELTILPSLGYTYHLSDLWGLEIIRGSLAVNFDTGLESQLDRVLNLNIIDSNPGLFETNKGLLTSSVVFKPNFGKFSRWNSSLMFGDIYFNAGLGVLLSNQEEFNENYVDPALSLGFGLRLWNSKNLSSRLEFRDIIVFKNIGQNNPNRIGAGTTNTFSVFLSFALNVEKEEKEKQEEFDEDYFINQF